MVARSTKVYGCLVEARVSSDSSRRDLNDRIGSKGSPELRKETREPDIEVLRAQHSTVRDRGGAYARNRWRWVDDAWQMVDEVPAGRRRGRYMARAMREGDGRRAGRTRTAGSRRVRVRLMW